MSQDDDGVWPEGYPERMKESIFAHTPDRGGDPGATTYVLTRGGGRLNVYALQYLGRSDETGDVYRLGAGGTIGDLRYDPEAEGSEVAADVLWGDGRPRLSRPVRRWIDSRDMALATRENLLDLIASEKRIDLVG